MASTNPSTLRRIDFNCDLGEGCGGDAAIIPLISAASIACGGHAGDTVSMRETVALCQRHGVAIGAHPSFDDRGHFGRRELALDGDAVRALVMRQVGALAAVCNASGAILRHVKPHGALYNLAAREADVAASDRGRGPRSRSCAGAVRTGRFRTHARRRSAPGCVSRMKSSPNAVTRPTAA